MLWKQTRRTDKKKTDMEKHFLMGFPAIEFLEMSSNAFLSKELKLNK